MPRPAAGSGSRRWRRCSPGYAARRPQAGTAGAFLAGWRLVSWDATMLDVPDSPANTAAFITSRNRKGAGAFAKIRLMALIEVGTHAVIDAVFGADSEQVLAGRLLGALQPGMLLLGDRNFASWRLWGQAAATGAHLLWRAKAGLLLPRDRHVHRRVLAGRAPQARHRPARRALGQGHRVHRHRDRDRPETGAITTRTELFRLLTTITDPTLAHAADLADCYRQRWESETGYKAIKTYQRGPRAVLRSTDPDGVHQELYAYLITYQAIRA